MVRRAPPLTHWPTTSHARAELPSDELLGSLQRTPSRPDPSRTSEILNGLTSRPLAWAPYHGGVISIFARISLTGWPEAIALYLLSDWSINPRRGLEIGTSWDDHWAFGTTPPLRALKHDVVGHSKTTASTAALASLAEARNRRRRWLCPAYHAALPIDDSVGSTASTSHCSRRRLRHIDRRRTGTGRCASHPRLSVWPSQGWTTLAVVDDSRGRRGVRRRPDGVGGRGRRRKDVMDRLVALDFRRPMRHRDDVDARRTRPDRADEVLLQVGSYIGRPH